jgi:NAD(P)H dehydrogenase (quinone)
MSSKKIFIWVAHPKQGSLCEAIADAYQAGAAHEGSEVRRMDLHAMDFTPEFESYRTNAPLEPDLIAWQENVAWADHIFVIHPYWWAAMPTKAKAVLDRALLPGFAFKYHAKGVAWDKLLSGKTADAIITSDTPPWLDTLLYRKPGRRVLKDQVLGFCGIKTKHCLQFGSVKLASEKKIARWMSKAQRLGAKAAA